MLAPTLLLAALALGGCQAEPSKHSGSDRIKSDPNERFTESEYGVKASPRVTDLKKVRKGGGREQVGRPYKVRGKWYYPKEQVGYVETGKASWYGSSFHGRLTANGEVYDMFGLSGAHPTFPLPSYARVTNVKTGANVVVRVNDRGPYVADRMMDLSSEAAEMLGYKGEGVGTIKVEYVGKAPLEGDDTATLMASYHPGNVAPSINDGLSSGVMLAMNETPAPKYGTVFSRRAASLPGVRGVDGVPNAQPTSIDAIISGAAASSATPRLPPVPKMRSGVSDVVVASYAPAVARHTNGAADALATMTQASLSCERIEIGTVDDLRVLADVRRLADGQGRLIAEAGEDGTTYSLEVAGNKDADALLQAIWKAGATDAFVLRN